MKWNVWFKQNKTDMRWLKKSTANRVSRCDMVWSHVVQPEQPRLQVDNGAGPARKGGHGKRHQYLCVACAFVHFGIDPPAPVIENQEELF